MACLACFYALLVMSARLANAVKAVQLSTPPPGAFDVHCEQLNKLHLQKFEKMPEVDLFLIPIDRIHDLIAGEERRGLCKLVSHRTITNDEGNVSGANYLCSRGKERKSENQEKAAGLPTLETLPGTRRSAIEHHESVKIGCSYSLHWRVRSLADGDVAAVYVRNQGLHVKEGETSTCHGAGCSDDHSAACQGAQQLTNQCKQFVRQEVLKGNKTANIIERTRPVPAPLPHVCCMLVALFHTDTASLHVRGVSLHAYSFALRAALRASRTLRACCVHNHAPFMLIIRDLSLFTA